VTASAELLADAFGRIRGRVHDVLEGLSEADLSWRLDDAANSIGWLVWHLTRIQDDHVAAVAGCEQVWISSGWCERFGLPLDPGDTGYGHDREQVAAVACRPDDLIGYHDEVSAASLRFVRPLTGDDLSRVVDERWDPPVTLGVRLVSVVDDDLEHVGQAAFVRGVLERRP
jgi:hypothetical protein